MAIEITQGGITWTLLKDGEDVIGGKQYADFRGDMKTLDGGRPPLHSGSTGKIWCEGMEYFPSVLGMNWARKIETKKVE